MPASSSVAPEVVVGVSAVVSPVRASVRPSTSASATDVSAPELLAAAVLVRSEVPTTGAGAAAVGAVVEEPADASLDGRTLPSPLSTGMP